jgi:pyruvate/2-oxoglutarate dehydrogenase complex dihydrolipoamide dehydrogenase (E3) component
MERFDLVVIGGGAAGINALKTAVKLGATVALVDSGPLGGTCINRG